MITALRNNFFNLKFEYSSEEEIVVAVVVILAALVVAVRVVLELIATAV